MANRSTAIGRLARSAPDLAKVRIRSKLVAARGNVSAAGRLLGIERMQMWRYIVRFDLWSSVDNIRERNKKRPTPVYSSRQRHVDHDPDCDLTPGCDCEPRAKQGSPGKV